VKVRFAIAPGIDALDTSALADLVDGLEARGFDTLWLSDIPLGSLVDPLLGLAYAAGRTSRLKLGANVVPFGRNPLLLAKELAQLDRLSAGRLLISLVSGIDQPGEREALGIGGADRGRRTEEIVALLRRWWDGEAVVHEIDGLRFDGLAISPLPIQSPLEIWLGGIGPKALDRVGRIADGWLGAMTPPPEIPAALARIRHGADTAQRTIDPEHMGMSLAYARTAPDDRALAGLRRRKPDADPADLLPVGRDAVRNLVDRYVSVGVSKFVLRPLGEIASWDNELDWLGETVLDLTS
jgi:probable F420-dependent oxidoreductase